MSLLPPHTSDQFPGLVISQASDSTISTPDGESYLDLTAGFVPSGLTNTGYGALAPGNGRSDRWADLAGALGQVLPEPLTQLQFTGDQASALATAVALARRATGRAGAGFVRQPALPRLPHALATDPAIWLTPFPEAPAGGLDAAVANSLAAIEAQLAGTKTAVIVVEPVLGGGSCLAAPAAFLAGLRQLADAYGAWLALDESETGYGRCGALWAAADGAAAPDLLILGGAMAGGRPLAAVAAPGDLREPVRAGGAAETAVAPALATLEWVQSQLIANSSARGEQLAAGLQEMQERYPFFGDVRGHGLLLGIDIGVPGRGPDAYLASQIQAAALEQKLLLATGGPDDNILLWRPPLTITADEITAALAALEEAFEQVFED